MTLKDPSHIKHSAAVIGSLFNPEIIKRQAKVAGHVEGEDELITDTRE